MRRARLVPVLLLASALPVWAQAPDLEAPDGATETRRVERKLDTYPLPVSPFGGPSPTLKLTGAAVWRAYRLPATTHTVTSVIQDYRQTLSAQGFTTLLDCTGDDCGGFDFRFEAALLPPPDMAMDVQEFAQLSVGREGPASYASVLVSQVRDDIFIQIVTVVPSDAAMSLGSAGSEGRPDPVPVPRGGDHTGGTAPTDTTSTAGSPADGAPVDDADKPSLGDLSEPDGTVDDSGAVDDGVTAEASATDDAPPEAGAGVSGPDAPDGGAVGDARPTDVLANTHMPVSDTAGAAAAPPKAEPDGAAEAPAAETPGAPTESASLLDVLTREGHVPITGVDFETSGTALTSGSGPALDGLAKMLTGNPDLSVVIVGHSDNQGSLQINIDISQRRAASVRRALIDRGVAANRLEARGIGFLAPRRSNATEEGRALNRRVELVLR